MNAENNLLNPGYFIPEPWILIDTDCRFWSKKLTKVIHQVVNDHSQRKITFSSLFFLIAALAR